MCYICMEIGDSRRDMFTEVVRVLCRHIHYQLAILGQQYNTKILNSEERKCNGYMMLLHPHQLP